MPNTYDLANKIAIVTGGAKGIGRAIARRLATSGSKVWVWDADPGVLKEVSYEAVDVTDPGQISNAVARITGQSAHIDILVNNAGYLGALHPFGQHESRDWLRIVQVNLIGMMTVTQAVLPHMRGAGGGRIIKYGLVSWKGRARALGSILSGQRRRDRFHEGFGERSSSAQHFCQLRRAWTH